MVSPRQLYGTPCTISNPAGGWRGVPMTLCSGSIAFTTKPAGGGTGCTKLIVSGGEIWYT
eukprot:scaffold5465_cov68-Attheya_sp.AAC.1